MKRISGCGASLVLATALCFFSSPVWSALSISKVVQPEVPMQGEPVEFTITVENDGSGIAADVHVTEQLPAGLSIPTGTAPFVSQGFYDVDSGDWSLGDVASNTQAVMMLPAMVDGSMPPPCLVNSASIEANIVDPTRVKTTASVAVRQEGVERCVDLSVQDGIFTVPQPFCSNETSARLSFNVRNRGPAEAQNVTVAVSHSPGRLPGFQFVSTACLGGDALHCELGTLASGAVRLLSMESASFNNGTAYTVTLSIVLSTPDTEYAAGDNRLTFQREVPRTVVPPCEIPNPLGGNAGCFIATAGWGHPWHNNVVTLQQFRDRHLLTNAPGRAFVRWYYRVSPPVAAYIAERPTWRAVVRMTLMPVVGTIRHPYAVTGGLLGLLFCLVGVRRHFYAGRDA